MDEYDENSIRADVRGWIDANWDPNAPLVQWRSKLADSGWGMPTWPKEWFGKDLPQGLVPIVDQEFSKSHAIGVAKTGIRLLAAATLLEHGTEEQKKRLLKEKQNQRLMEKKLKKHVLFKSAVDTPHGGKRFPRMLSTRHM